jgi:hypothetical protein
VAALDTPWKPLSAASLKHVDLWLLDLQLLLGQVIDSSTGHSVHVDVWEEGPYGTLGIHYRAERLKASMLTCGGHESLGNGGHCRGHGTSLLMLHI